MYIRTPQLLRRAVLLTTLALALAGPVLADTAAAGRYYEDALTRFDKQDVAGAIIQLKNALQQDREMLAAHLLLGRAYLAQGEFGPAEVALGEALRLGVSPAEVSIALARIYLMQGKPQTLIDKLPAAGLPRHVQLELLALRGTAYAALGKPGEATRSFADSRAIDPASAVPLIAEVPVLLAAGKAELAGARADDAVRLAPQSAAAYNARGSVRHGVGDLAGALADYERAIALQPDYLDPRVARAGILVDLGREAEARKDLEGIAAPGGAEPRVAYLLALLADRRGDSAAAARHLAEVAGLVDVLPIEWLAGQEQLLMAGALAHHAGRQYEKARKYLDLLVSRYPRNLGARRLLAAVYVDTADHARATSILENLLRAQPDDAQALYLLGRVNLAQKRYAKAAELLEKSAARGGGTPSLQASLGVSRLGQGDQDGALRSLQAAFDQAPHDLGVAVTLTQILTRRGASDKALDVARRAAAAAPTNPAAWNLLGMIRAATGDLPGARQAYAEALGRESGFTPGRLNLARIDVAEGRFDEARKTYAELMRKNRRDATVMYESALLEQAAGNTAESLRWMEKAAAEKPADVRIGLGLVGLRSATGNHGGAREAARALAARRTGDLAVLAALAETELATQDRKAAQQTLREMTRLAEFDAPALVRIGYLQLAAGNPDGAAYSAQKALQGRPGDIAAQVLAIEVALGQGEVDSAADLVKQLRSAHPGNADGLRLAAELALLRRQHGAAAELFRQALERAPDTALLSRYAQMYVAQGDPGGAIPIVQRWLRKNEGDVVAREMLGELFMRVSNWRAARSEYEHLIGIGKASGATYNNLANVLIALKEGDAIGMAEKAVQLTPGDAGALDTLAWALARAGRFDESMRHLRDARLRAPENAEVRWHLAYVLARTGRKAEAQAELEAALKGAGAAPWREAALALAETL